MSIEHTRMYTVGRTTDRCTQRAGWAAFHYRRHLAARVWDAIFVTVLAASVAVGVFAYLSR